MGSRVILCWRGQVSRLAAIVLGGSLWLGSLLWSASGQTGDAPPVLSRVYPEPGSTVAQLTEVEVLFSEPVTNVDVWDLRINGHPAVNLVYGIPGQFVFQFAQPTTGLVQVAWSPTNWITDLGSPPLPFAGGGWSYTLNPQAVPPLVVINEFLAANSGQTYRDEDGASSDWIELYNTGTLAVNLLGWALTDDPTKLDKWLFPNYTLPPSGYLVVFASGKDRTNVIGRLHTNFQLNKGGGYLSLLDANVNLASVFVNYPAQSQDVSYGRTRADLTQVGYFATPTPGAANSTTGADSRRKWGSRVRAGRLF